MPESGIDLTYDAVAPEIRVQDYARAREIVMRHGWNSTSFQIINPGIKRWFSPGGDAVTGYVTASGYRIVAGSPVCEKDDLEHVVKGFEVDTRRSGKKVCYFAAESRLESLLAERPDHSKFLLGAQPVWQPADWAENVRTNANLRKQINRSKNKGVEVAEWTPSEATDDVELRDCLDGWLGSKGLPPLRFMVATDTLSRLADRRIFVARHAGTVAGFIVLSPVPQRNGWLFEQFPHQPGAPNGTVELMIDTAMRSLAADGYGYATLGLSPLSKRAEIDTVGQPLWLKLMLGWLRTHGRRFYNFDGLDSFKAKLGPAEWEPVFAVSNEPRVSFKTLYAIAGAFSGNAPISLLVGGMTRALATEVKWLKGKLTKRQR